MGFEEVKSNNFVKSNSIAKGEHITGYVIQSVPGGDLTPNKLNILMLKQDKSSTFTLVTHGNLNYFWDNNPKPEGILYRFTRLEDKKSKLGKMLAQFKIEKDTNETVEVSFYQKKPTVVQTSQTVDENEDMEEAPGIPF